MIKATNEEYTVVVTLFKRTLFGRNILSRIGQLIEAPDTQSAINQAEVIYEMQKRHANPRLASSLEVFLGDEVN